MVRQIDNDVVRGMSLAKVIEVYLLIAEINQQTILHDIRWLILCVDVLLKKFFLIVPNIDSASFEEFISGEETIISVSSPENQKVETIEKGKTVHPAFPVPCDAKYGCSL